VSQRARDECAELNQMLGAYLHQDFDLEYSSAEDVASVGHERGRGSA
jgi:hypothetical protein